MDTNTEKKKVRSKKPTVVQMSINEKIHILANIIVDRILEEQQNGTLDIYNNQKQE